MTDDEEVLIARKLPKGATRALLAMTATPTLPGRGTFNASAAFNLQWQAKSNGGLVGYKVVRGRKAYYLTPLGERIKSRLAERRDP